MQSFDVCQARTLGVRAGPNAYLRLLTQFSDLCLESGEFRAGFARGLGEVAELVVPGGGCLFQRMNLDTSDVEVFGSAGCLAGVSDLGERNQILFDALAGEVCLAAGPFCSFPCSGETVSAIMGDGGSMDVIGFGAEVFALVGIAGRVDVLLVVYGPWAEPTAESAEFLWMLLATLKMLADRGAAAQQAKDLFFRVQRAKQEWEAIVDALPQLVCVLGGDGNVLRANRTLEAWGLGQLTRVRGTSFLGMLWQLGIFRTDLIEKSADWARGGVPELGCLPDCLMDDALWSRLKTGLSTARLTWIGLEAKGGRYYDLIIGDGAWVTEASALSDCSVAVLVDVTERHAAKHFEESYREILKDQVARKTRQLRLANRRLRVEMDEHERSRDAMRLLEQRYQLLADNTLAGVFLVEQGHIAYHNRRFASLLGYAEGGLVGQSFAEAFESKCDSLPHPEQGFANQKLGYECQFLCKDGRKTWLHVTQALYPDGVTIIGNAVDISDLKGSELKLRESNSRAAQLSKQILVVQERERNRIARELHDAVGQQLTAAKLTLENVVAGCELGDRAGHKKALVQLAATLRETIKDVRRVAMALRPSMLNDLGIAATLSWFSREIEAAVPSMQVRHRVDVDEESISPQLKTEIFRISQEALNNVCKHARASTVELTLTGNQRGLDLVIRDNGRGIISGEGCPCGVGMGSMRERVELTGGELFIVTVDGKGVAIICRWVTPHSEMG